MQRRWRHTLFRTKGGDLEWAVKQAGRDLIKWRIRGDVILNCDQEEARMETHVD